MVKPKKNQTLYYYTTVETMRYILTQGNIYATDLKYMNDAEEYRNGLCELRKVINEKYGASGKEIITEQMLQEMIESDSEVYSISFSEQRDLLSQWSMYARESGVSLTMQFNGDEKYLFYFEDEKNRDGNRKINARPKQVYYFTERVMKESLYNKRKSEIVNSIENENDEVTLTDIANVVQIWKSMTPYVKRYEFYSEGEYRLAFSSNEFPRKVRVDYRIDEHVLKPYLDVECLDGWPIQEIIVGPGFNQNVVYESILHFIRHAKLKLPKIDGKTFAERCAYFFYMEQEGIEKIKEFWNAYEVKLEDEDEFRRYQAFGEMQRKILQDEEVDLNYKKFLKERYLSKEGVLIKKSEIPYIF